jgi:hypothetical protein
MGRLSYTLAIIVAGLSLGTASFDQVLKVKLPIRLKPANEIWVMSIDTGVSPHYMLNDFLEADESIDYIDTHGHGSHVAGLILYGPKLGDRVCPEVRFFSCRYYQTHIFSDNVTETKRCLQKAIDLNMDIVNYSSSGETFEMSEYRLYKKFKGIAVVAAGNDGYNISVRQPAYPALYGIGFMITLANGKKLPIPRLNNVIPIASVYPDGGRMPTSNWYPGMIAEYGYNLKSTGPDSNFISMSGTSQATAVYTHRLLKERCNSLKQGVSNGQ